MNLILIVFLIVLNALFAMSEMALAASRRTRLVALAETGNPGAKAALALLDEPTQFLSSVQVGITSIGVLNGIVGEAAFSAELAAMLEGWGWGERAAALTATAIVVTGITFATIIFGELVPKRIGQLYPETVACWVARPMRGLARLGRPFVWLLSTCTQAVLRLLRVDTGRIQRVTEEEIAASLEEGVDAGLIEAHEHQMVQNVFHLDDRPLTSLMVPRAEIDWLEADASVQDCLEKIAAAGEDGAHSWYPVCRGSLDDVIGLMRVARLLQLKKSGVNDPIGSHVQPVTFVPETLSAMELLEQLRQRSGRMVLVVDEYGVVQGLLTPHDLLEAITGELRPLVPGEAWATRREDGSWLLDGLIPLQELKARLEIDEEFPDEDKGRYTTLAGLLLTLAGRLPRMGEHFAFGDWDFEIVDLDGRRIDRVLARPRA
jgi:putative hemolysin